MKRFLTGMLSILLILSTAACSANANQDRDGQSRMPASTSSLVGEHFEVVVEELEAAGFTNVQVRPLGDLITGWLKDDGEVEKIRIDGKNSFGKGNWFAADSRILITYHSFPVREEEEAVDSSAEDASQAESDSPEPSSSPSGPSDAERSAILDQRLKEIFGGVGSMSDLLVQMPGEWPGYVTGVRVEGDLAYFTLQVDRNTSSGQRIAAEAARALSTLLGKDDVQGISWLIVEDGTGVEIDQKRPAPTY